VVLELVVLEVELVVLEVVLVVLEVVVVDGATNSVTRMFTVPTCEMRPVWVP
jgi:hypothetical protein